MKKYICKYTRSPINVNGDLSKKEWVSAEKVSLVDVVTGEKPSQKTTAMLLWDENYLYVAFDCIDDYIMSSMIDYNQPLYDEDVVEIFIDDDGDKRTYLEIEVNPNNAVLHYEVHNKGSYKISFARIEQTIISAVKKEKGRTTYEIAIPTNEFLNPIKSGVKWHFNLYRIDRGNDGFDEYTAFSPTGEVNYHHPECFATIEFAG